MTYRPRSYAAYIGRHSNLDVIADATSRAACNCREFLGLERPRGLREACPRHAPNQYALMDARHVLEGARS